MKKFYVLPLALLLAFIRVKYTPESPDSGVSFLPISRPKPEPEYL